MIKCQKSGKFLKYLKSSHFEKELSRLRTDRHDGVLIMILFYFKMNIFEEFKELWLRYNEAEVSICSGSSDYFVGLD